MRVLVVEDDSIISMLECRMLSKLGHEVIGEVKSGEEAISFCSNGAPDLIIMDICLCGEIDGIEATRQIKSQRDIPVVFISGNYDRYGPESDSIDGFHTFISKPFTICQLSKAIKMIPGVE